MRKNFSPALRIGVFALIIAFTVQLLVLPVSAISLGQEPAKPADELNA